VTEVIAKTRCFWRLALLLAASAGFLSFGQDNSKPSDISAIRGSTSPVHPSSAETLFLQLGNVGLDKSRVYRARDVSIDRAAFHITLDDGVIAFTEDVGGRVTGAFFVGDGEILLTPPNQIERASMMLQTGAAILEERFISAYFRFNDDTFADMQPTLQPAENAQEFVSQWNEAARHLAASDALRLFMTFSSSLPVAGQAAEQPAIGVNTSDEDRFLHAHLQGQTKGVFEVYFESNAPEQVSAGQLRNVDGAFYYDVWTSFSLLAKSRRAEAATSIAAEEGQASAIDISSCKVKADIRPPTTIEAEAVLDLQVRHGGQRAALFELARTLVIRKVEADGQPVEFIHNPAIEGTQLARSGNDLVAVVFPQPTRAGQRIKLRFVYSGEVLSEAGPGLLYVGARGTWYPNRGLSMSNFDLEFHYPPGWTLVATGKRVDIPSLPDSGSEISSGKPLQQASRWVSERPIPFAGFNLGKYKRFLTHAGEVTVEAFATAGVERGFPQPEVQTVIPDPSGIPSPALVAVGPTPPSPARNEENVAAASAHAIDVFSHFFGAYPFSGLALTQFPGTLSQGWPGLIFLSSLSFLTAEEKSALHFDAVKRTEISAVIAHETAHQWWGDLVIWNDYRDQWVAEALADYSSLMLFEASDPLQFRAVMERYRDDLLQKNKAGRALIEDGPVTLGARLSCSQFPDGYQAISYGRGTWLLHMLRYMMRDAEEKSEKRKSFATSDPANEPFLRALRRMRERYQGRAMTTRDMLQVFEEELPRSLWYEGHKSLDWFYEGWINGTAVPRFEPRGVKYIDKEAATTVSGVILQKDAPKDLVTPVPLYASHGGKLVLLGRVFADGPETYFHLTAPPGTRKIVLDPNQTLLARSR
jgi:Peptidase family M1 domain